MGLRSLSVLFLAVVTAVSLSAAPVLIDNFNTTQFLQVGPLGGNPLSGFGSLATGTNSLGGFRAIQLTRTLGSGTARVDINNPVPGILGFSNDAAAQSELQIWWDGDSNGSLDFTNLAVDLTDGGTNTGLRLGDRSDLVVAISLRLYTNAANYSTVNFNTPGLGTLVPFSEVFLPFASFTPTGAGANFTNITAVLLSLTGPASFDLQLDFLEGANQIPEPMSVLLVGGALFSLGVYRRRRMLTRK